MEVRVISGDISKIDADTIVTAINSGKLWFGGIDAVIRKTAGDMFHSQVAAVNPLYDGQAIVARHSVSWRGCYKNVVFVVDDLKLPLSAIVFAGLKAAADAGFKTISLPTIRLGVMLGVVEKTRAEALGHMIEGVRRAKMECGYRIEMVTFVVYNDRETKDFLDKAIATLE